MAQFSGPWSKGTAAEKQFTDSMWWDIFGTEPGIRNDYDGSAYGLTLPSNSDIASVGSGTQVSYAILGGFLHWIPQSQPEPVTIPAAVGGDQYHLIVLEYDPAWSGAPGPIRLKVISGTVGGGPPSYDASPPGTEHLMLWMLRRSPGQALSQAQVTSERTWRGGVTVYDDTTPLPPTGVALGEVARKQKATYYRVLVGGSPQWQVDKDVSQAPITLGQVVNSSVTGTMDVNFGSFTLERAGRVSVVLKVACRFFASASIPYREIQGQPLIDGALAPPMSSSVFGADSSAAGEMVMLTSPNLAAGSHTIGARLICSFGTGTVLRYGANIVPLGSS